MHTTILTRLARYCKREVPPVRLNRAEFVGLFEPACLELGVALLWVVSGKTEAYFFVRSVRDETGRLTGYRLTTLGNHREFTVDLSFGGGLKYASCSCGAWSVCRAGGCLHCEAIRRALAGKGVSL